MAATCMAVCKGSRKKIRGIFISSCHLPAAVECDIVILSEPGPNPTGPSWAVLQTQLIPARGRKPRPSGTRPQRSGHNLSPRGDGNLIGAPLQLPVDGRHNLSPRGDGNCGGSVGHKLAHDTTYPREGTETIQRYTNGIFSGDTTYPREGTETCLSPDVSFRFFYQTQLIPARGRKLSLLIFYPPF